MNAATTRQNIPLEVGKSHSFENKVGSGSTLEIHIVTTGGTVIDFELAQGNRATVFLGPDCAEVVMIIAPASQDGSDRERHDVH